ncbi:calcium-binding mitochondrial carrier protein SCaMC-2-A-like [Hydractinia symbiolongicarpus]|uniref:calcium-binding mitochondrial carrier protein SCaMC-2-A-like n=1 Tax=Hydractinia symbiolongicarpus TaxID=13093 RepID=UPI00254ECB44|nr:calcium-binding mitochondrial carrier protein SCaMC-2-A-like [Hydractinia symbiolongicarpus]
MEVIKTKLAIAKTNQYNGIYDCARTVMKTDGIRGFYRGMTPALLGMIPYAGIDLCIYETMKNNWINSYSGERKPNCFVYCLSAFTSATIAQSASYPLGLVRTKLQAHSSSINAAPVGMVQMFKSIVKEQGYSGLYRGIVPSYLKVLPSVTITYIMYEYMRQALGMPSQQ